MPSACGLIPICTAMHPAHVSLTYQNKCIPLWDLRERSVVSLFFCFPSPSSGKLISTFSFFERVKRRGKKRIDFFVCVCILPPYLKVDRGSLQPCLLLQMDLFILHKMPYVSQEGFPRWASMRPSCRLEKHWQQHPLESLLAGICCCFPFPCCPSAKDRVWYS